MGVVVIGAVFVDIKGYPNELYIPAGRNAGRVTQVHGGVSRNVAEDIANVELRPTFVSVVDQSGISDDVINKLNRHKVNTQYIRKTEDGLGTWLAVFDNEGDVVASISKRPNLDEIASILDEQGDEIIKNADSVVCEIDMKAEIMKSHHVHCDETPFVMPEHSKEYMWVFHSPGGNDTHPLFLYEYLGGRSGKVLEKYLSGYQGILVTDGYQPYHTLMKNSDTIQVAGCYAHARRKFAEIIKSVKKGASLTPGQSVAAEAVKRIDAIYHLDNMYKNSSAKERLNNRQQSVKPLVDAYFAWLKTLQGKSNSSSKLKEAINYSINQEIYLRKFLEDPDLPLDNNDAERSIKSFCVGKHSWHIIDSVKGAKASALLYSIAESAKANSLKPYEYFCYLLKELVKHPRNNVPEEVLKALMPWSEEIPDHCRKTKSR